jgi:epsilon-lactone hydrolase
MNRADDIVAADPVERVIARIQSIYRGWNKATPIAKMRADWDAAFACSVSVAREAVSAGGVKGEWIAPAGAPDDKAILYFHGGGFRLGSVASHRDLIARIAAASGCRALAIDYRLAPEHRFPAPLEDALAAYHWMREKGFAPQDVALAGDSAGGNLVLGVMLRLREGSHPLPTAAALMSPWTDLTVSGASYETRAKADPIHQRSMILALARNYLGEEGDPRNPFASPIFADLAGLPPLLIQVGDRETVLNDSTTLANRARSTGVAVELEIWDRMIHVFQMFPELVEAQRAVGSLAHFLRKHLHIRTGSKPP